MDAISYSYANKQAKRIEKFIENPDSISGIVTVPKTIASGETVTIPAGRVAVLPNVQIDGVLNVEGEVFIPSGATLGGVVEKVTSTDNAIVRFDGTTGEVQNSSVTIDDGGNLNITGTGKRITGDFSNLTEANKVAFQTSTVNSATVLGIVPNGTSTVTISRIFNSSDMNNSSCGNFRISSVDVGIWSSKFGTGSYLPMTFYTSDVERMRIDTSGNVLVTGAGGLGYGTGSGGTVTQLTNKNFNVSLNKPTGTIITSNSVLVAGQGTWFIFLNSLLSINDHLKLTPRGSINYDIDVIDIYNGAAAIRIINKDSISHSDAISINFSIEKGAIS